jgi:hypothetical protein
VRIRLNYEKKKIFLFELTLGLMTGLMPKRAGRSGVKPFSLHRSSSSSWNDSWRGTAEEDDDTGDRWNRPTALVKACRWSGVGTATGSSSPSAGDNCKKGNTNLVNSIIFLVSGGPENSENNSETNF